MRFLLTFCACYFLINLTAQTGCPFKMALDTLHWEGNTITLKLIAQPMPATGKFEVYRKCLSEKNSEKKYVGSFNMILKCFQFPDSDPALKSQNTYVYRAIYSTNERCFAVKQTQGRAVEDDDEKDGEH